MGGETKGAIAVGENVPVRCPVCRRAHAYTPPVYPCACGAPVTPPLMRGAPPEPITHRTWTDEWVTVRCGSCGRQDQWPQPELGCPCGTVLRVPVRPVTTAASPHRPVPGTGGGGAARGGTAGTVPGQAPGGGPVPGATTGGAGRRPGQAPGAPTPAPAAPGCPVNGAVGGAVGGAPGHGASRAGASGPAVPSGEASGTSAPAAPRSGTPATGARSGPASGSPSGPVPAAPGSGPGAPADPAAEPPAGPGGATASATGLSGVRAAAPQPGPHAAVRPSFNPVTIRTARDVVTAAALYLRWLGFRDVVQPEERRSSMSPAVELRGPGLVAQVDPTTRPVPLRAVECLWLEGLASSSVAVYFSLAGYEDRSRARADGVGLPLFVMDLTGTPQPVNSPADDLLARGA
ncbi:hypothetical protein K701_10880 [Streptomyces fradiae ATCC 10745 = DSM 40063]|uniref:Uncharacterized protein n=2 Tax=Streptomyces fradiae TaxID=1906 RepID=A0A1Y2NPW9_STRFR|nr:hypothetical protein K701_10880 [Streptomyces fradiae ATCC 10745 = DSM 40063]OSY49543.1 hypothetical protein BG846_04836 [Streptomyces fradiae ATCC 10745 = DSM 40063]